MLHVRHSTRTYRGHGKILSTSRTFPRGHYGFFTPTGGAGHRLDPSESPQTPAVSPRRRRDAKCSPQNCYALKESSKTTESENPPNANTCCSSSSSSSDPSRPCLTSEGASATPYTPSSKLSSNGAQRRTSCTSEGATSFPSRPSEGAPRHASTSATSSLSASPCPSHSTR